MNLVPFPNYFLIFGVTQGGTKKVKNCIFPGWLNIDYIYIVQSCCGRMIYIDQLLGFAVFHCLYRGILPFYFRFFTNKNKYLDISIDNIFLNNYFCPSKCIYFDYVY